MKRPYIVVDSESFVVGRFNVIVDTLLINGKQYSYSYLMEDDCVCVTVLYKNSIVLLNQYRHAINEWKLEFPCGGVCKNEEPIEAARREVLEETGIIIDDLIPLESNTIRPGISTGNVYNYLAICSNRIDPKPDPTEIIKVCYVTINELENMIKNNEFEQMLGLICWMRAKSYLETR